MAAIQGKDVLVNLSTDGTTYKTLICEVKNSIDLKRQTSSTQTKCNSAITQLGLGAYAFNVSFDAVCDDAPGSTQVTYNDLLGWLTAGTLLYVKVDDTGTVFKHISQGYITDVKLDNQVGEVVKFSGTFSGTGPLTIV